MSNSTVNQPKAGKMTPKNTAVAAVLPQNLYELPKTEIKEVAAQTVKRALDSGAATPAQVLYYLEPLKLAMKEMDTEAKSRLDETSEFNGVKVQVSQARISRGSDYDNWLLALAEYEDEAKAAEIIRTSEMSVKAELDGLNRYINQQATLVEDGYISKEEFGVAVYEKIEEKAEAEAKLAELQKAKLTTLPTILDEINALEAKLAEAKAALKDILPGVEERSGIAQPKGKKVSVKLG